MIETCEEKAKKPRKTKMMRIPEALEALVATKREASIPPT
jgi:hypothetical protein